MHPSAYVIVLTLVALVAPAVHAGGRKVHRGPTKVSVQTQSRCKENNLCKNDKRCKVDCDDCKMLVDCNHFFADPPEIDDEELPRPTPDKNVQVQQVAPKKTQRLLRFLSNAGRDCLAGIGIVAKMVHDALVAAPGRAPHA